MGVMLQKNKRNEAIYARKQERLTLITMAHLPLVISIFFFCLWSIFSPPSFLFESSSLGKSFGSRLLFHSGPSFRWNHMC